jgi:Polyketide cyclase / dehydrase and lipid transport
VAAPVLAYRGDFEFTLLPDRLWDQIDQFGHFESWWPWLTEFRIEGDGLSAGSVLHGVVNPPLPYRMRLRIELVECQRPRLIDAVIGGDLVGDAHLLFRPQGRGTLVEAAWTVEMRQPAMRLASRLGGPVLRWGHDRVVDMTVAGLRRQIEAP